MDSSPFAHIAYTLDYTVLAVNRQHLAMTGKRREDLVGRNLYDVFPPNPADPSSDARVAIQASLDRMIEKQASDDREIVKHDILRAAGGFDERFWQITHSPIWNGPDGTGEIIGAIQTTRDVTLETVRKRVAEAQKRTAMISGDLIFFELDLATGSLDRAPRLDEIFGFAPGEVGEDVQTFVDRIHPEDRPTIQQQLADAQSLPSNTHVRLDYRVIRPNGEMSLITTRAETIEATQTGGSRHLTGVVIDVTDLRRSEAELRNALAARDELVAQKELLLHEVNHRIKNSLQLVSSILSMDARSAGEGEVKDRLDRAAARVMAVTSVHELIYKSGQVTTVDLEHYLVDLCRALEASGQAKVTCQSVPLRLSTDKAISLALLVNELVSNAFEHAFIGQDDGHVKVTTVRQADTLVLTVSDNGAGKAADSTPGLGSKIVTAMVAQLDASMEEGRPDCGSNGGYQALIRIPIVK